MTPARAFIALMMMLASGCGGAPVGERPEGAVLAAAKASGAPAYVWSERVEVRFEPGGEGPVIYQRTQRRLVIAGRKGNRYARLVGHITPAVRTIDAWRVRAWLPDGTVRDYTLDDFADAPAMPGFQLYGDNRARVLALDVPIGTVIDSDRQDRFFDVRMSAPRVTLERRIPVRRLDVVVDAPARWTVEHRGWRLSAPIELTPDRIVEVDGRQRARWHFEDLEALRSSRYATRIWQRARRLTVRLVDWGTGAAWPDARAMASAMATSYRALATLNAEARALARRLVDGATDDREKARRIAEWVRDSIRYCSISIGLGGWVPHAAGAVFGHRYGDCKDQATLTTGMLAEVGIPSEAALIHTHEGLPRTFEAPVLGANFNHAVVRVRLDPPVYFDPTASSVPFGELGASIAGAQALPLNADAGLETLPESDLHGRWLLNGRLAFTGLAWAGEVSVEAGGMFAHGLRGRTGTGDAQRLRGVRRTLDPLRVDRLIDWRDPKRAGAPIALSVRLTVEQPGVGAPVVLNGGLLGETFRAAPPVDGDGPVLLGHPHHKITRVAFEWPHPVRLPPPVRMDCDAGRYVLEWRSVDGAVVMERAVHIRRRVGVRASTADWIAAVRAAERVPIVLEAP